MEKKDKVRRIIFWAILIVAILARIAMWPEGALKEINVDEAMTAVNADYMANTGKDIYGTSFPVYLEAWQYTGQSVLLMYITAIFIKILGASTLIVRLPMLLISILSLIVIYDFAKRIFKNKDMALIILALTAISPWHIMQSKWAIDCNLFPHFLLISIYLFYLGLTTKRKLLYLSMIFFGITMYSYGISIYIVPFFLLVMAIYLRCKKRVSIKELLICILIYFVISFPILLMYVVNFLKWDTLQLGPITIPYFAHTQREQEMIFFSQYPVIQLLDNIDRTLHVLVLQYDGLSHNAMYGYGTIYLISFFFFVIGIIEMKKKINEKEKWILGVWLILSLLLGCIIQASNINKLNCIWYIMILMSGYGIYQFCQIVKKRIISYLILSAYIIGFIGFNYQYYTVGVKNIEQSRVWSSGLQQSIQYASKIEKENMHIDVCVEPLVNWVYGKYACNFYPNNTKKMILEEVKQIEEDTVYIIKNIQLKEEWKEYIKATFVDYMVISK